MNTIIVLVIFAVTALILLWQFRMLKQAKKCVGKPAPNTSKVDGSVSANNRIYYFHGSHCGQCKAIDPLVDSVRKEHPNLIQVDVAEHMDLVEAFGVKATPSFIVVCDEVVSEVKLGGVSEAWLKERLSQVRLHSKSCALKLINRPLPD